MSVAATPETPPAALASALAADVEAALAALDLPVEPADLYAPVRHVLAGGGKRVRPVLLLLVAEAFGAERARAMDAAVAVELFHNFTLVHDDIMDRSDERRGRPTVHVRWDEPTAILAGDLLHGLAWEHLARSAPPDRLPRILAVFGAMTRRLCEGQALDMRFESRDGVTVADYLGMIEGKTGALLEAAFAIGGLVGGAADGALDALRRAGHALGRGFQLQDDLLDLTARDAEWGKPIGGDLIEGKRTYLLLTALERARTPEDRALFGRALGGLPPGEVDAARDRMRALGVLDAAADAVDEEHRRALAALDVLPPSPAADALRWTAGRLASRAH